MLFSWLEFSAVVRSESIPALVTVREGRKMSEQGERIVADTSINPDSLFCGVGIPERCS